MASSSSIAVPTHLSEQAALNLRAEAHMQAALDGAHTVQPKNTTRQYKDKQEEFKVHNCICSAATPSLT